MGLLDGGIQSLFGSVFGGLYLDGTWIKQTLTDDGKGGYAKVPTNYPMKYQKNDFSSMQRAAGNIPANDVQVFVLQHNAGFEPKKDDRFVIASGTYAVVDFKSDPANSYWQIRGSLAGGA